MLDLNCEEKTFLQKFVSENTMTNIPIVDKLIQKGIVLKNKDDIVELVDIYNNVTSPKKVPVL